MVLNVLFGSGLDSVYLNKFNYFLMIYWTRENFSYKSMFNF
jgi:hypothetical protein